jgi:sugar phosphate permease
MGLSIKAGIFSSILLPIGQACAMYIFPVLTDKVFGGKREPLLILCAIVTAVVMPAFPFIKSQALASGVLFIVGVSGMVTGILWAVAGDLGGKALSGTATGILDWAAYMGAAIQSMFFGAVVEKTGNWNLPFIIIAVLYVIMVILAFMARKMKLRNL